MTYTFDRKSYLVNKRRGKLSIARDFSMDPDFVWDAVEMSHRLIDQIVGFDIELFPLLGMRNLSAFIGELFAASVIKVTNGTFVKNPHQDGYPDLLLMDKAGKSHYEALRDRLRDKSPFSPFSTGGVEVKATCGSVPTPAALMKRGLTKPDIGQQRVRMLVGYDWKAHHQDTNNLMSLFWDFIDGAPRIIAVFYCDTLTRDDWGKIVQPREGGGRTTSVSIMTRAGVRKMFDNWVIMLDDADYKGFFERRNSAKLA
ncbi:hypothetical protein [Brevundimonas sp. SORGH_AS_0993]|uniref:hypothetical protein n=1 Tax=Brevundimonas sp. SORGH_AS_0993 TaxID=3041794 RepID=UPI002781BDD0|nr:hypothetical protein [Brevundimonas sp. SORGH_AS_0993]MDQ1154273.1 hypothetical protein [Brevundimonas sp. SORGH_AS_0993]